FPNIYRLLVRENQESEFVSIQPGILSMFLNERTEIKESVRIAPGYKELLLTVRNENFIENDAIFSDSTFFRIFDVNFLEGNQEALMSPNSIVVTERAAKKYFGEESAINKTIVLNGKYPLVVSGVISDAELKSHLA